MNFDGWIQPNIIANNHAILANSLVTTLAGCRRAYYTSHIWRWLIKCKWIGGGTKLTYIACEWWLYSVCVSNGYLLWAGCLEFNVNCANWTQVDDPVYLSRCSF